LKTALFWRHFRCFFVRMQPIRRHCLADLPQRCRSEVNQEYSPPFEKMCQRGPIIRGCTSHFSRTNRSSSSLVKRWVASANDGEKLSLLAREVIPPATRRPCGSTMERARFHGSSKSRSLVNDSGGSIRHLLATLPRRAIPLPIHCRQVGDNSKTALPDILGHKLTGHVDIRIDGGPRAVNES